MKGSADTAGKGNVWYSTKSAGVGGVGSVQEKGREVSVTQQVNLDGGLGQGHLIPVVMQSNSRRGKSCTLCSWKRGGLAQ